jgi:hypothetical protein
MGIVIVGRSRLCAEAEAEPGRRRGLEGQGHTTGAMEGAVERGLVSGVIVGGMRGGVGSPRAEVAL